MTKVGIPYLGFGELLRKFSSEIDITRDKVSTSQEKDLLVFYEKVLECYQDSLTVWKAIIEYHIDKTGGQSAGATELIIKPLRPLFTKYYIDIKHDTSFGVDFIPATSLQKIWLEAAKKADEANDIFLSKQTLETKVK